MAEIIDRRISFNGGEFSPWTDPRLDLEKYRTACRRMENFRPTVYGGAFRRAGTIYLGEAKEAEERCRLVEFEFSVTTTAILEFGDEYLRFWTTGPAPGPVGGGTPYEIATAYSAAEVAGLQFAQQNDVVYISHPNHAPRVLSRLAVDDWTLEELDIEWPPELPNDGATTLAAAAVTGGAVALTASAALFQAGHVGSTWVVKHRRTDPTQKVALNAAVGTNGSPLMVLGEWSCHVAVNTGGDWERNAVIQRSYDKSTWETIRSISSSGISSGTIAGTELDPCWLRIRIESGSGTPPASGSFVLEAADPDHYGLLRITAVASGTAATAAILFELGDTTATKRWSEPAWSGVRGFPRAVSFHENRLMFGGTTSRPQTVWGSIVDDYANFRTGSDDDMGLALTLSSDAANGVQWLVSQESLIIGTTGSEWVLGSRSRERALSGTTASARRNTNYGSEYLQARLVGDAVLFVQRAGRKVREFVYTFESDNFAAQDMTLLAEHVTDGGIVQVAVQRNPETVVWFVTGDGELLGLTYDRGQNVAGWSRHTTQGKFESVAIVSGGEEDEIWVAVRREADGDEVRYIERFQPDLLRLLKDGERERFVYADAAVVYDDVATDTITGLDHLEGCEVTVLADGSPHPDRTVEDGEIHLQFEAERVVVGLRFESVLEPTFLESNDPAALSKAGVKRLTRATVEVWRSLGMEISANGGDYERMEFRTPADLMDAAPPLFSGVKEELLEASSERQASVTLRQRQPLPLNLMSLHLRYDLNTV